MGVDIKMTPERRKQIKKDQEEAEIEVVKVSKKRNAEGYHVSDPHFQRFSMLQYSEPGFSYGSPWLKV